MQTKIDSIGIIDDDEVFHFTMKIIIRKVSGINTVHQFYDGEQAIEYFKQNAENIHALPELIFLDLNMPYMDGWQFLDEFIELSIKDYQPQVYVVTSSNNQEDIEKSENYQLISGYKIKPISKDDFILILKEAEFN